MQSPVTITDDRGKEITSSQCPERIVAISYMAVDLALALSIKPVATTYMMQIRHPDYLMGKTKVIEQIGQRAEPNLKMLEESYQEVVDLAKLFGKQERREELKLN